MTDIPTPPTNIVIHTPDGAVPADATYQGLDQDGNHVWRLVATFPLADIERVTMDVLPPHTSIELPVTKP